MPKWKTLLIFLALLGLAWSYWPGSHPDDAPLSPEMAHVMNDIDKELTAERTLGHRADDDDTRADEQRAEEVNPPPGIDGKGVGGFWSVRAHSKVS